jgi:hypothetical protein
VVGGSVVDGGTVVGAVDETGTVVDGRVVTVVLGAEGRVVVVRNGPVDGSSSAGTVDSGS